MENWPDPHVLRKSQLVVDLLDPFLDFEWADSNRVKLLAWSQRWQILREEVNSIPPLQDWSLNPFFVGLLSHFFIALGDFFAQLVVQ